MKYFAAGVDPVEANVMYAVQQPILLCTFETVMGAPAWRRFPSWYLVAKNDQVIPPDLERSFAKRMGATTIEIDSGHLAMVAHPDAVTDLIIRASEPGSRIGRGGAGVLSTPFIFRTWSCYPSWR